MLAPSVDERLLGILGRKAGEVGSTLIAGGCAVDHVHVLLRLGMNVTISELVQRMKGASAYELNRTVMFAGRFAWQPRYWLETLGPADLEPLRAYVVNQRARHDPSHPAEQWTRLCGPQLLEEA
jgi:putative transposase